jgi:hypothetical protein
MLLAAGALVNESLHSIAERLAAEVDLTDDSLPWIVGRSPGIGDKAAVRLMLCCAGTRSRLAESPAEFEPLRRCRQSSRCLSPDYSPTFCCERRRAVCLLR